MSSDTYSPSDDDDPTCPHCGNPASYTAMMHCSTSYHDGDYHWCDGWYQRVRTADHGPCWSCDDDDEEA